MKITNTKLMAQVDVNSKYGQIVASALYLNSKEVSGLGIGVSVHEQVAQLILKGFTTEKIIKKTGFKADTVHSVTKDIINFVGAVNKKGGANE
jgi:hypothetical protein